eukprot:1160451-Pelagomonas_calceolata.AAC.3
MGMLITCLLGPAQGVLGHSSLVPFVAILKTLELCYGSPRLPMGQHANLHYPALHHQTSITE